MKKTADSAKAAVSQSVEESYKATESLTAAAKAGGVSRQKARKLLITAGLYTTPDIDRCIKLWEQGKTIPEIATELEVRENTVSSMLPYSKGEYNLTDPGRNAAAIRRHRERRERNEARKYKNRNEK